MMIGSKSYKGIEYIEISELPQTQREKLVQTISRDLYIKILIDGKIVGDCIQFKDYSYWYNTVFKTKAAGSESPSIETVPLSAQRLALNN
jgi:hypothetical protein